MYTVRQLFDETRPIDRQITSIINYAGDSETQLEAEIREYEVTDSLGRHYERLMNNLADGFQAGGGHEVGVWVSGFYGSGKSSFTKYLGFAFDPSRKIKGDPFLKWLQNQFPGLPLRQQLATLAARFPATVIMLDLASVASARSVNEGISRLLYDEVMDWAGYSKDEKLRLLEFLLEKDGKLADFEKRFSEVSKGHSWASLKNDLLLGPTHAGKIAAEFYPDVWTDAKAFHETKVSARYSELERLRQMLDLIERRTKSRRVLFVVDEVGHFITGGSNYLISNLQGLTENLRNIGNGEAWILATAQQTLPMHGQLSHLKDRFPDPLRVDIESSDIKEITHRRLLRKNPIGVDALKKIFKQYENALLHATQLKTKHPQANLSAETFTKLYPFLPQHFAILMELLRSLARSTGGIGLRSAIKVIQDSLVDVSGYRTGQKLLADAPEGTLATADIFFDTLRRDIERVDRQLVETVDDVCEIWGDHSIHGRIAKTVAVLQLIEGFPVSRHNVAALLHSNVNAAALKDDVNNAVEEMLGEPRVPLTEIDESLRFLSADVSKILNEKSALTPSSSDAHRIVGDRLKEMLSPEPSALVGNTLKVKTQLKLVQGSMPTALTHSKEEVEMHLELAPASEITSAVIPTRIADSRQPGNHNVIYLVGEDSAQIRDLVREIHQCQEIQFRHAGATDKEVAEFVRGQAQRAEILKRDLETGLQNAFLKGSFVFRGKPQAVSMRGTELLAACKAELSTVAADVFNRYKEAPVAADASAAEKLLQTRDLSAITAANNLLDLVVRKGQATHINAGHPALVSILDYLRKHGEVDGRKLLDDFSRAPFGWFKDTTRYLVAGLLIHGGVRLRIGAQWIKVAGGEKALEVLKSNVAFGKADVTTNDETVPQEALLRAAKRLLNATAKNILPMPQNISRGVQEEFPKFQRDFASLAAELTGAGLLGAERAGRLLKQLAQILQGDASEAPTVLGAEECELVDNILWAREVRKAFEQKLDETAREAAVLLGEIPKLPKVGAADMLIRESDTMRGELADFLTREDFFLVGPDIRNRLTSLRNLVKNAAANLADEFRKSLDIQRESLRSSAIWLALPEADRGSFSDELDALTFPYAADLDGIRRLLNTRIEVDNSLTGLRSRIEARSRQVEEEKQKAPMPGGGSGGTDDRDGEQPKATPIIVRARHSYASAAELQQLIVELQTALATGQPVNLEFD
jgi:hypothetical protein